MIAFADNVMSRFGGPHGLLHEDSTMDFSLLFSLETHGAIHALARHCQEISRERQFPRRQDFRPTCVGKDIGYLFLANYLPENQDYYFPLGGSYLATLFGVDLANTRLSQLSEQQRLRLSQTYGFVLSHQTYQYIRGCYVWPDRTLHIERLLVPMTGKDETLNTVLGIVLPDISADMLPVFTGVGAARLEIDEEVIGQPPA